MRIALQPAFVLHHRAYRETSILLDLFTEEYGRVAVIARGVRQNRSRLRSLLQPFVPLLVSWQGNSELMTMLTAESNGYSRQLRGECLFSGLYLNELLMRVLHKQDPHPELYTIYQDTLLELQNAQLLHKTLRLFEKRLLETLGYGLQLKHDAAKNQDFIAGKYYRFHLEHGFEVCEEAQTAPGQGSIFSGKSLLALATEQLDDAACLYDAKRLMRLALAPLLGERQLRSRQLFINVKSPLARAKEGCVEDVPS